MRPRSASVDRCALLAGASLVTFVRGGLRLQTARNHVVSYEEVAGGWIYLVCFALCFSTSSAHHKCASSEFVFRICTKDQTLPADGFAFVLQNSPLGINVEGSPGTMTGRLLNAPQPL